MKEGKSFGKKIIILVFLFNLSLILILIPFYKIRADSSYLNLNNQIMDADNFFFNSMKQNGGVIRDDSTAEEYPDWAAIDSAAAYLITGDSRYREDAIRQFNYVMQDDHVDGYGLPRRFKLPHYYTPEHDYVSRDVCGRTIIFAYLMYKAIGDADNDGKAYTPYLEYADKVAEAMVDRLPRGNCSFWSPAWSPNNNDMKLTKKIFAAVYKYDSYYDKYFSDRGIYHVDTNQNAAVGLAFFLLYNEDKGPIKSYFAENSYYRSKAYDIFRNELDASMAMEGSVGNIWLDQNSNSYIEAQKETNYGSYTTFLWAWASHYGTYTTNIAQFDAKESVEKAASWFKTNYTPTYQNANKPLYNYNYVNRDGYPATVTTQELFWRIPAYLKGDEYAGNYNHTYVTNLVTQYIKRYEGEEDALRERNLWEYHDKYYSWWPYSGNDLWLYQMENKWTPSGSGFSYNRFAKLDWAVQHRYMGWSYLVGRQMNQDKKYWLIDYNPKADSKPIPPYITIKGKKPGEVVVLSSNETTVNYRVSAPASADRFVVNKRKITRGADGSLTTGNWVGRTFPISTGAKFATATNQSRSDTITKGIIYQYGANSEKDGAGFNGCAPITVISPPWCQVSINNNSTYTTTTNVILKLTFSDSATHYRFAKDTTANFPNSWSKITSSPMTINTQLSSGADGQRKVYAQCKYRYGNTDYISSASSDSIFLDTTKPTGSFKINNGAAYTATENVALNMNASDAGSGLSQMLLSTEKDLKVQNWCTYASSSNANTKWWAKNANASLDEGGSGTTGNFIPKNWSLSKNNILTDKSPDRINPSGASLKISVTTPNAQGTGALYQKVHLEPGNYRLSLWNKTGYPANPPSVYLYGDYYSTTRNVIFSKKLTTPQTTWNWGYADFSITPAITENYIGVYFSGKGPTNLYVDHVLLQSIGDGKKYFYAKFKDGAGNTSILYQDDIILDRTPPTAIFKINNGAQYTKTETVTLNISASDNLSGVSLMYLSSEPYLKSRWWQTCTPNASARTDWPRNANYHLDWGSTDTTGNYIPSGWSLIKNNVSTYKTTDCSGDTKRFSLKFDIPTQNVQGSANLFQDVYLYPGSYRFSLYYKTGYTPNLFNLSVTTGNSILFNKDINITTTSWAWSYSDFSISTTGNYTMRIKFDRKGKTNLYVDHIVIQSIGDGKKYFFAKFKDGAGNESTTANAYITLDKTAPTGSISINSGQTYTSSNTVSLTLTATDSGSGLNNMRFSNDNSNWSIWQSFSSTRSWDLSTGEGVKTVYVKFSDKIGNVSNPYSDSIIKDTVKPTICSIVINSGDPETTTSNVTLLLYATDSGTGVKEMWICNDTNFSTGTWEEYVGQKSWPLSSGYGTKTVYVKYRDYAENESNTFSDSIEYVGVATFTEDFNTTTYKDVANTTADWNTTAGELRLPQFSAWTRADGVTPGYDNVSNNSGRSYRGQMVLDSNSRPNIVWEDFTPGIPEIYFSKWSGSAWTKADGTPGYDNVSNNSGESSNPQVVLDSNNRPNIVWEDFTPGISEIYFSKWNGSAWTKADGTPGYDNLSNNSGGSWRPQLVLDSNNRPNIVWEDGTTGYCDIYFSKWSGSAWTGADGSTPGYDNISNNSGGSWSPQIVLDSSQRPNIVWFDNTLGDNEIFFSMWNGSAWTKADGTNPGYDNVSNDGGASCNPQIVLDSSQRSNIVWYDSFQGDIYFSKWSGSAWTRADGSTPGYDNVSNTGRPSYFPQIVLDSSQRPNIVWYGYTIYYDYDIYFSKWNGSAWTQADGVTPGKNNVSNNSGYSEYPQLVLDSSQRPNIVWHDYTTTYGTSDIFFSKWNGSDWAKADGVAPGYDNISNNSDQSEYPQLVLDSSQRPNIVWQDFTPGHPDIYFSKYTEGFQSPARAQSLKVNTITDNIAKATLTVNQDLSGQTINYYLSNNGGANWEPVTPAIEYTFTTVGNDLRWKAVLSTSDKNISPVLLELTIVYKFQ